MRKIIFVLLVAAILLSGCPDPVGDPFSKGDALKESNRNIRNLVNELGIPKKIQMVTFEPDQILSAKLIEDSEDLLGLGQVCVLVGNSRANDGQFEVLEKGRGIKYQSSLEGEASLWLMCSKGKEFNEDLSTNGLNTEIDISNCTDEFNSLLDSIQRVCIIAITE